MKFWDRVAMPETEDRAAENADKTHVDVVNRMDGTRGRSSDTFAAAS